MGLLNPLGLLWLGLMLPVILLYLLRLRRRELTIGSVLWWEQAIVDLQANAPFQRLRRNLLLYLQLAVILLAALAAARPYRRTEALGGETVVAILDGSASMAAVERAGTRFDQARRLVEEMITGLDRGEELMLILAADRAEVLHPFASDRRSLLAALRAARPMDRPTDLRDALSLAASAGRAHAGAEAARVYLLSDGAVPDAESLNVDVSNLEFVRLGAPLENLAITAFDLRRRLTDEGQEVLLALRLTGAEAAREVGLELRLDGRLFDVQTHSLTPGETRTIVLDNLPSDAGLLEARLAVDDALAADNVAYVSLGGRRQAEVWLLGESSLFLEKALLLCAGVNVVKAGPATAQAAAREGRLPPGTVLVFAGSPPAEALDAPALYLDCAGPGAPVVAGGSVDLPSIVDWDRQHPVTIDVDLGEVAVSKAMSVTPQPWATVLCESAETPLIVAGERAGGRQVFVGFAFVDSDFPLRPGFPIFIANCIDWLSSRAQLAETPTVRAGDSLTVRLDSPAAEAELTAPDGSVTRVPLSDGVATLGDLRQVGVHTLAAGGAKRSLAVSLLSPFESDLTPGEELRIGAARVAAPVGRREREREVWPPFVIVALGLLLVEWWWFHRRG